MESTQKEKKDGKMESAQKKTGEMRMQEINEEMEKSLRIQEICIKVQIGCLIGLLVNFAAYLAYCLSR